MSGNLKLNTALGGSVALTPENTASNITVTVPAATGTLLTTATSGVPIGGPAFSAFQSTATSAANNTTTKIQFNSESFDTNSNYDTALYRFTPTVSGYYQVILITRDAVGSATGFIAPSINKNGTIIAQSYAAAAGFGPAPLVSVIVFMNGSTDYLEAFYFQNSGNTATVNPSSNQSYFQAAMIRSAT
jgi:hypothetical protein